MCSFLGVYSSFNFFCWNRSQQIHCSGELVWSGLRRRLPIQFVFKCLIWISFLLIFINYAKDYARSRARRPRVKRRHPAMILNVNEIHRKTVDDDDVPLCRATAANQATNTNTSSNSSSSGDIEQFRFVRIFLSRFRRHKRINSVLFLFHDNGFFFFFFFSLFLFSLHFFELKVRITRRMDDINGVLLSARLLLLLL